jgi:ElaB/YqjD/DUF883 family membrane-anchored ribosome-binding protein
MERTEKDLGLSGANATRGQSESAFHRIKLTVAEQISRAAQALHQRSTQDIGELSGIGQRAADWLERSAGYVRDMEPQRLKSDLEDQVRRNPGRSLLIAGAVGIVLGRILRRR